MEIYGSEAISVNVGKRIKELREARKLSMRQLAYESGISANALSNIERNRTSPTVSTLYKLAGSLNVPITSLFQDKSTGLDLVFKKADERTRLAFPRGLWEGMGGEDFVSNVEPFILTLESGANSGPYPIEHSGNEFVICLRGVIEYQVENQTYKLEPGDSLLFSAHQLHRWRNPGNTVANVMIVLSGFCDEKLTGELHVTGKNESSVEE
jgi:transcriptional regulator with XRE-family HTH domain